jgi:hydroxymethylbilane synthase
MVVCKQDDAVALAACNHLNDAATAICTKVERDFLRALLGGCSTPISALAEIKNDTIFFKGNIVSVDGKEMVEIDISSHIENATTLGAEAATQLLAKGGDKIAYTIRNAAK